MINQSDTVQTCTLGLAFIALFVGALSSLQATPGSVLYNNQAIASTATETTTVDKNKKATTAALSSAWSTSFATVALAASKQATKNAAIEKIMAKANNLNTGSQSVGGKTPKEIHQQAQDRAKRSDTDSPVMTRTDKEEILWLARIMYSETKRLDEQRIIGWVVRNRVDTGYTGRTYENVAKHSGQFSGLHPYDNRYEHNMSRWYSSSGKSWQQALSLAKEIYFADDSERPLALTTRHFYSPNAASRTPAWAKNRQAVQVIKDPHTNQVRFALYDKVR